MSEEIANDGVDKPRFREVQRFRQWWVWLLVYGCAGLAWYSFFQQIILGQPFGSNPGPDWMVWLIWLGIGIGFPVFIQIIRLTVEVWNDAIRIRYLPLVSRLIPLTEIRRYRATTYNPVRDYGGWGIRGWSAQRRAYNVSGDQGVELELTGDRRVMIGTQRPSELARAIAEGLQEWS